jgi:hypothetical protein
MTGAWRSVHDVLRELDEVREDRMQRPLPYVEVEGNPFPDAIPCPVIGCRHARTQQASLTRHLEEGHNVITVRDLERLNAHLQKRLDAEMARRISRAARHQDDEERSA